MTSLGNIPCLVQEEQHGIYRKPVCKHTDFKLDMILVLYNVTVTVIIFYCNKLSNRIGHQLLQLILSLLFTCNNDNNTYTTLYQEKEVNQKSHELMQTRENRDKT